MRRRGDAKTRLEALIIAFDLVELSKQDREERKRCICENFGE